MWTKKKYSYPEKDVGLHIGGVFIFLILLPILIMLIVPFYKFIAAPNSLNFEDWKDSLFFAGYVIFIYASLPRFFYLYSDIVLEEDGIILKHVSNFYNWTFIPWENIRSFAITPGDRVRFFVTRGPQEIVLRVTGTPLNRKLSKALLRERHDLILINSKIQGYEELKETIQANVPPAHSPLVERPLA